jgi:hypothetical protein
MVAAGRVLKPGDRSAGVWEETPHFKKGRVGGEARHDQLDSANPDTPSKQKRRKHPVTERDL